MKLYTSTLVAGLLMAQSVVTMNAWAQGTSAEPNLEHAQNKLQAENKLRQLLHRYDGFSAEFEQTVFDSEHNPLHTAQGQLQFKQPGKFRWQVLSPEPELLLSNGQILWWFNPFIEQVSIFDAEDAVETTPFALLVSQDDAVWNQFDIKQNESGFQIRPKRQDAQVVLLDLAFRNEQLAKIEVTSRSQRLSRYELNQQRFALPDKVAFDFEIPAGTDIDDQRKSALEMTTDGKVQF